METYLVHTFSTFRVPRLLVIEIDAADIVCAINCCGVALQDIIKVELKIAYMQEG